MRTEGRWERGESAVLARIAASEDPLGDLYQWIDSQESRPDRSDWNHLQLFEWIVAVGLCCAQVEERLEEIRPGSALSAALTAWSASESLIEKVRAEERIKGALKEAGEIAASCSQAASAMSRGL